MTARHMKWYSTL